MRVMSGDLSSSVRLHICKSMASWQMQNVWHKLVSNFFKISSCEFHAVKRLLTRNLWTSTTTNYLVAQCETNVQLAASSRVGLHAAWDEILQIGSSGEVGQGLNLLFCLCAPLYVLPRKLIWDDSQWRSQNSKVTSSGGSRIWWLVATFKV